uniref:Lectin/glucanase superfamily protein n=1 Tax=viral metagenome TaxID=1070528 RepID=A0A6C0F2A8_9ZZZZ
MDISWMTLIIVILLIVVGYFILSMISSSSSSFSSSKVSSGITKLNTQTLLPVVSSPTNSFTFSTWIYINNIYKPTAVTGHPIVWTALTPQLKVEEIFMLILDTVANNLNILIGQGSYRVPIHEVPLQTWVSIIVTVINGNSADFYINGKLVKTVIIFPLKLVEIVSTQNIPFTLAYKTGGATLTGYTGVVEPKITVVMSAPTLKGRGSAYVEVYYYNATPLGELISYRLIGTSAPSVIPVAAEPVTFTFPGNSHFPQSANGVFFSVVVDSSLYTLYQYGANAGGGLAVTFTIRHLPYVLPTGNIVTGITKRPLDGYISTTYDNKSIEPQEAWNIYSSGSGSGSGSGVSDFFDKYKIRFAFVKDNVELSRLDI